MTITAEHAARLAQLAQQGNPDARQAIRLDRERRHAPTGNGRRRYLRRASLRAASRALGEPIR